MALKGKLLLAEDDVYFGNSLKKELEQTGYEVQLCPDGETAWRQFQKARFDLCLLDVIMPKTDGLALSKLIRSKNDQIPILLLSACRNDEHVIAGFKHGADDYIRKPISLRELQLRIGVFLRRTRLFDADNGHTMKIGNYTFDYTRLRLLSNGYKIKSILTQREADLLRFLCENANKTIRREEILLKVWGKDDHFLGRSMDVFMTKIRKLFDGQQNVRLETVHGIGFVFRVLD